MRLIAGKIYGIMYQKYFASNVMEANYDKYAAFPVYWEEYGSCATQDTGKNRLIIRHDRRDLQSYCGGA